MVKKSKEQLTNTALICFGLFLSGCANQLPPGGGDIDRIPPEIAEVYPPDETINFNDKYFELGFSEFVDKRSVKDAIFISPAFDGEPELDWSGRYVRIYFPSKLRDSTTYIVTIGTDVVDHNNKNRMAESFTFAFSTGDKIDRKMITGRVYDEKPEGVMLFAYKVTGNEINPSDTKPDYISQTGLNGQYRLAGLAAGSYRVFAIQDEFRDLLYQLEQDKYGAPYKDVYLSEEDTLFAELNFFLTPGDTSAPVLQSAVMTDQNHILLNFSEPIDSTIIRSNNFWIMDSTSNQKFNPLYAYKGNTKPHELVLSTNREIKAENKMYVFVDSLKDKRGNLNKNNFAALTVSDLPDTIKLDISKTIPVNNSDRVDFLNPKIFFQFNDGIDSLELKKNISFSDTGGTNISYHVNFLDDASFIIEPAARLYPLNHYVIQINLSNLQDAAGNKIDSVYKFKFKTISGLDFTGVSGTLLDFDEEKNPLIVLESIAEKRQFKQKISSKGKFNFERMDAGKYLLWTFYDKDSSGVFDYGWVNPYKPSSQFSVYPDTLDLRPRWSVTDLKFRFDR
jgi:hypothetical protein